MRGILCDINAISGFHWPSSKLKLVFSPRFARARWLEWTGRINHYREALLLEMHQQKLIEACVSSAQYSVRYKATKAPSVVGPHNIPLIFTL